MPSGKPVDWNNYDQLLYDHLPKETIRSWRNKYAPDISEKAVGSRAKKLGIKPLRYIPTIAHRESISIKLMKETPEMVDFIRREIDNKSRKQLAMLIGLSNSMLADIIKRHNIKLSETGKKRSIESSRKASIGRIPWNKGKHLTEEHKTNMAIGRQKMSGRLSKLQQSFYRILDENQINYLREDSPKCRFGPWVFDCRIIHGDTDMVVEVQGDYTHSLPKNQSKDKAKATYMERYFPNIPIKYVWEHEFGAVNRVKQKIRQWLNLDHIEQIDFKFSDIKVREITESEATQFLSAFHYLGKLSGRFKYGAFLQEKLIAVAIFSAPTRVETAIRLKCSIRECLELRRFVIHDAYHKKNFASYLLSKIEKKLPKCITTLVSFADTGFDHNGTIYKAANWILDGECQPSYYYIDGDGYVVLKKTLYNLAHKMHMKENDYAATFGYDKVKTPSKLRFVRRINNNYF